MTTNRPTSLAEMSTRQKVIAVLFILLVIFLIYEVISMFRGSKSTAPVTTANSTGPNGQPAQIMPQPAQLQKIAPLSPRELEMMQLQKETEAKYLAAVNQLQMLKIEKDIAQTNKEIMSAKLDTVKSQKGIVDALEPKIDLGPVLPPSAYSQTLNNQGPPTNAPPATPVASVPAPVEVAYVVVSVANVDNRWTAVIGYQGKLYNVFIGDVLAPDGSTVTGINRYGVELTKDGVKKKVSMVSII